MCRGFALMRHQEVDGVFSALTVEAENFVFGHSSTMFFSIDIKIKQVEFCCSCKQHDGSSLDIVR